MPLHACMQERAHKRCPEGWVACVQAYVGGQAAVLAACAKRCSQQRLCAHGRARGGGCTHTACLHGLHGRM